MKARDFFEETSRQTFVAIRNYKFLFFSEGQICHLECKIRPASIFGEPSEARTDQYVLAYTNMPFKSSETI